MMKTETLGVKHLGLAAVAGLGVSLFLSSCTPEGVINKTKYNGQKVTNTCESFTNEVNQIVSANSNTSSLAVAEYDNSDADGYYLDVGQYEIKDGMLNCRLASDLEYEKYCKKGVAVHVTASYNALDHLSSMESPASGDLGMLVVDEAYVAAHKAPFFMYSIPLTDDADLNGKQLSLKFSVVKYDKKGKIKKVFCNTVEAPLGPVKGACCNFQPWETAPPASVVEMPDVKIDDEKYRYRGFTGTLDLIFPENSAKFDKALLTNAITNYIQKYQSLGFKVTSINLEGWASLGGKEDLNQKLSDKRAQAVYDDLKAALNDSTIGITFAGKGEDWDRLKLLTKTSALSGEEQQAVLSIANGGASNDEKEKEMRLLPFWKKLVDEVIVNTRHTFVTFKFDYAPDKMYVEYYPSSMPVISDELYNVATKEMIITKYRQGEDVKKNLKTLDILIGNNKKANLYAMRSTYQFAGNDFRKAIEDIDQALKLNGSNSQYAMASLAYKTKFASSYTLEERMSMLDQYNDYVKKYPDNVGLAFNRAVMMDKVGFISGALTEYSELLEGREPTAANLNNRGVAKLKTMRLSEAEADFMAALEKNPNLGEASFNLAAIYAYKGLTNKVIENLDRAVMNNPALKEQIWDNAAFAVVRENPKFDKYR
jgi:tetratricopeptide (TPR) repeat protein